MRLSLFQAGLAAALTLCAAAELLAGPDDAAPMAMPAATAAALRPAADDLFTPRWASIILARPLFRPDRRPLAVAAAAVDNTLPRLSAIVITADGRRAIFVSGGGAAAVVSVNGRVGVYQVRRIAADSVSLLGPNGDVTVHPEYAPTTTTITTTRKVPAAAAANSAAANVPPPPPPPPPPRGRLSNDPM